MKTLFNIFILIIVTIFFTKCSDDSDYTDAGYIEPTYLHLSGTWATMSMDTLDFIHQIATDIFTEFFNSYAKYALICNVLHCAYSRNAGNNRLQALVIDYCFSASANFQSRNAQTSY